MRRPRTAHPETHAQGNKDRDRVGQWLMRGIKRQAFWLGFLVSLIAIFAFLWALPTWAATLASKEDIKKLSEQVTTHTGEISAIKDRTTKVESATKSNGDKLDSVLESLGRVEGALGIKRSR